MRKRKAPVYNYDWFSYPPEWDEQAKRLCQQDAKNHSTTTSETETSPSIESTVAKKGDESQIC
jgi:hypothetical protein